MKRERERERERSNWRRSSKERKTISKSIALRQEFAKHFPSLSSSLFFSLLLLLLTRELKNVNSGWMFFIFL